MSDAVDFEQTVTELTAAVALTVAQRLYASCGLADVPNLGVTEFDDVTGETLADPWGDWNRRYGLRFRLRHGIPSDDDVRDVARRAGVPGEPAELRALLPELSRAVYPHGFGVVANPPGWTLLPAV